MSRCERRASRKGVNFIGLQDVGDPVEIAEAYITRQGQMKSYF